MQDPIRPGAWLATTWLALALTSAPSRAAVVINEIMYNSDGTDIDWVELYNPGPAGESLAGGYLLDENDASPQCALSGFLGVGEFLIVAGNTAAFAAAYPGVGPINPTSCDPGGVGFGLGNGADEVRLFASGGLLMDRVAYRDEPPWPTEPDGNGPSLELIHPSLDNGEATSWAASTAGGSGSPGAINTAFREDPPPTIRNVERDRDLPTSSQSVTVRATVADFTPSCLQPGRACRLERRRGLGLQPPQRASMSVTLLVDRGQGFVPGEMVPEGNGIWAGTIDPAPSGALVRYYIEARDPTGQVTTSPGDAPETYEAFTPDHTPARILINEILASNQTGLPDNAGDTDDWLELRNVGAEPVDLDGMYLSDDLADTRRWRVPKLTLAPGERALFWCDDEEFEGPTHTNFNLGRGDGAVGLFDTIDHGNTPVDILVYGPQSPDVSYGAFPEGSANEYLLQPTPGTDNGNSTPFSAVCINEFLAASQLGVPDWIELYNRGPVSLSIGGWHLSDDPATPDKYTFPAGTIIPSGGFLSVDEMSLGFALNAAGSDVLVLTDADPTRGRDFFDFGLQLPGVSQGRFPDGAANWEFFSDPSRDGSNGFGARERREPSR